MTGRRKVNFSAALIGRQNELGRLHKAMQELEAGRHYAELVEADFGDRDVRDELLRDGAPSLPMGSATRTQSAPRFRVRAECVWFWDTPSLS